MCPFLYCASPKVTLAHTLTVFGAGLLSEIIRYWTGEKMVDHAFTVALPIFRVAFPGTFHLLYASRL